jgi:hypothetical protein
MKKLREIREKSGRTNKSAQIFKNNKK